MKIFFLIISLVFIAISSYILMNLIKYHKNKTIKRVIDSFSMMGVSYLIFSILFFLWSFDLLKYAQIDFLMIYSVVIFIQTLALFKISYFVSKNKILTYYLLFYIFSFFSLVYSYSYFLNFFLITSFLLMLIISMNLTFRHSNFKNAGIFGILYSVSALIFQFLEFFFNLDSNLFSLISGIIFLIFLYVFLEELRRNPAERSKILKNKKKSYILLFFKSFFFIIVIANLVFIGTVGTHELGHFALSKIYECESAKIIYEGGSPYTEALCKSPLSQKILLLGGFLPFLISAPLFIFGGKFMKHISILISGFNLVILYEDLEGLGLSNNLIMFFILIGIIILITGIMLLTKYSVEGYANII